MVFAAARRMSLVAIMLSAIAFAGEKNAEQAATAFPPPTSGAPAYQEKARSEYTELLARVQRGDLSMDFRAFRIAGALSAGPHISAIETEGRAAFKKYMAESNLEKALNASNHLLNIDFASAVGQFGAMTAYRALGRDAEAVAHEKIMNALLDSIARAGDGKTLQSSYLATTTQEEYIFMSLRMNVKPTAQSLVTRDGHYYDRIEVTDRATSQKQYVWFNADVQMNPDGLAVPNSTASSNDSTTPVVVATAQAIAPVPPTPNGAGMQFNEGKNAPSTTYATGDRSLTVAEHAQPSQLQTLYDQGGVSVVAIETQDTLELAVSEPDPILVSVEVDRNQNGQFDRLVDVAFRPQANGNLCPQYLIDSQHNTPCGGFASHAYLKDFKDDLGRRQFVLVLPKKEISFDLPSARLVFVFRNSAQRTTSFYPVERFQKAINVSYSIKQLGVAKVMPTQNGSTSQGNADKSAFLERDEVRTPATAISTSWIDEYTGKSLGNACGVTYSYSPVESGAVFDRLRASRIEYRNLPREGTLEWKVLINSGYHYDNSVLHTDDPCAVLFSSDVSGGDVTWPGATRLTLCKNGDITLDMAEKKYVAPHQVIKAASTVFRFNEWHMVSISYGSQGQAIWLDGEVVSKEPMHQQWLGAAGTHQTPSDVPTIGETVSHFWPSHRYNGGFEGIVSRFRVSSAQNDWLMNDVPITAKQTEVRASPIQTDQVVPRKPSDNGSGALSTQPAVHSTAVLKGVEPDSYLASKSVEMDRKLESIAGGSAINCGTVPFGGDFSKANDCVQKSLSQKKSFLVRYDYSSGTDRKKPWVFIGLAGLEDGAVYLVHSRLYPCNDCEAPGIYVMKCLEPIQLHSASSGMLDCPHTSPQRVSSRSRPY
jgi:hypothetical protein